MVVRPLHPVSFHHEPRPYSCVQMDYKTPAGDTDKALSRGDRKSGSEDNRRRQGDNVNDGTGLGGRGGRNSPAENSLRMPGGTDEGLAPARIICQLSKRVARDPVRTPYGHVSMCVRRHYCAL